MGAKYTEGGENLQLLTEIAVYLGNGARKAHAYYGMLIGSHRWRINLCWFRWPWV